jgi:hypothetical protein
MREDSPAARITPPKLEARDMLRKIAESEKKVSAQDVNLGTAALGCPSSEARHCLLQD